MKKKIKNTSFDLGDNEKAINLTEIEIRYNQPLSKWDDVIVNSETSAKVIRSIFESGEIETQEQVIVLYLNRQNKVKGYYKHTKGGLNSATIDVRPILAIALKTLSIGIIIAHNHPSGNLQASSEDLSITRKLRDSAKFMDIILLDHIIITEHGYYSLNDEGLM